jgi:predicted phage baseplate assembly protein
VRFGDGTMGKKPDSDKTFAAHYRVGNGTDGNIGVGALCHIVPQVGGITGITRVYNPLPARGGVDMETNEEVRQFAPEAFRTQERAVTAEDYAEVAMRYPGIQKAVATFQWTGSWYTVFLVVDREAGKSVEEDPQFKEALYNHMEKYRMAGFDLELEDPVYVPLDIAVSVCVKPGYFKSDVEEALLKVFSNYEWEPGELGFFHPDNFTFAQPVYLSRIYESAVKVEGVSYVEIAKFERWGKGPNNEIENGILTPGRAEIVRLDNDPNYPENGKIEFTMKGGM